MLKPASAKEDKMSYIDKEFIEREMNYWRIPGAAIALFGDNIEEEIECFGYRDVENKLPFNEDTIHCIASCSKSMTALLIASLVAEGKLDFDQPVSEYLPEFQLFDPDASKRFTLRDMLCHRTGFGAHDVLWPCDRAWLAKRIRYIEPCDKFRNRSLYSNVMYALVGYVAEAVTGESWHDLMKKYVFDPVHMERTSSTAEAIVNDPNHAEPYYVIDGKLVKKPFWKIDGGGPAASVNTTIKGLMKWVKFHIAGGVNEDGERIIPEKEFKEMHKPHMPFIDSPGSGKYPFDYYCMAWRDGHYKGLHAQKHSGKIEGYSTFQIYLPEEKLGICMMSNLHAPTDPFVFSTVYTIFDKIFDLPKENWPANYHGDEDKAPKEEYLAFNVDVAKEKLDESIKGKKCKHDPEDFVGIYENPGHGPIKVYMEEGKLMLHYRDQDLALEHYGLNSFVMPGVLTDTLTLRVPVSFIDNSFGEVIKANICYEPQVNDIVFMREDGPDKIEIKGESE
jgi:CubicO group peptidase (beta-lactamase class C family)